MWLTSKTPTAVRTALCSSMIPEYWTGMSHPPKSTILAPRERWTEWSGVVRSESAEAMKIQANTAPGGTDHRLSWSVIPPSVLRAHRDHAFFDVGLKKPRRVIGLEPVTDAEDGFDILVGISTKLLPKAANVHIQSARPDVGPV